MNRYLLLSAVLITALTSFAKAQGTSRPILIDAFSRISNDELQVRVLTFHEQLTKDGSSGLVVLEGPGLVPYFYQRRIMGCGTLLKMSEDNIEFKFSDSLADIKVEFWKIPKGYESSDFEATAPDYKLKITRPVEMTVSMASDDFCPTLFGLDWYAKFLIANPTLNGRAVIDVQTKHEFRRRVVRYRKELLGYGVAINRMRYYHKHSYGEHDEQFWLIPPRRK